MPASRAAPYKRFGITPAMPPRSAWPYVRSAPIARVDTGVHDRNGVRMTLINGRLYDQPMLQAMYGIDNLESYVLRHDAFYLRRAEAQADRLISCRVVVGDAWFLPYRFDFKLHGSEAIHAPWYSASAQGTALTLFTRLYEVTGRRVYSTAAGATWRSMTLVWSATRPWASWVDSDGYLWLEEYAANRPRPTADRTVNGHLFALYGVWDYWRATSDHAAASVFDAAASTMRAYSTTIRAFDWMSKYCMSHGAQSASYHELVLGQWQTLYGLSRNSQFARMVDAFRADYPTPGVAGTVRLSPGAITLVQVGPDGSIEARRFVRVGRVTQAPADRRQRLPRTGIYYRLSGGSFAGWWVQEQPARCAMLGTYLARGYLWPRRVVLPPGTYTGLAYDRAGRPVASRTVTFATSASAATTRSAYFDAVLRYYVSAGALRGYWLLASRVIVS